MGRLTKQAGGGWIQKGLTTKKIIVDRWRNGLDRITVDEVNVASKMKSSPREES